MINQTAKIQLGKNGVSENFIGTLKSHFKNHKKVKISVLRTYCRDKKELKKISEKLVEKLGNHYTSSTIGYTINLKKWRKEVR